jgi:5-(carboxyamino)imidazole ribonucleotide synthase
MTPEGNQAVGESGERAARVPSASPARVVMIGAGQLARMTQQAAVDYAITTHVLATSTDDPAVTAGAAYTIGDWDAYDDLARVASCGEVVTFDHELVPLAHVRRLTEAGHHVRPDAGALAWSCDKLYARQGLSGPGSFQVPVPDFAPATTLDDVAAFADAHGWPVVLKRRSGGYDGRGVNVLTQLDDAVPLLADTAPGGEPQWLVEEHLDLAGEFAILLARSPSGEIVTYPPIGTRQHDGICLELTMPAALPTAATDAAVRMATSVIAGIGATGICAVEFFWTTDGRVLLNELALRPHNSGHATIEACTTSQFHQHLRAVLDWPLGPTDLRRPAAATVNVIANAHTTDPAAHLRDALAVPGAHVHLYQKVPRPGRKIGHVTALADTVDEALDAARQAANVLTQSNEPIHQEAQR